VLAEALNNASAAGFNAGAQLFDVGAARSAKGATAFAAAKLAAPRLRAGLGVGRAKGEAGDGQCHAG